MNNESFLVIPPALDMLVELESPIAIVAHDAGAANHISAWFETAVVKEVQGSFDGPARDIFRRQCPWMKLTQFRELLPGCKTLISGTSLPSEFEHQARKLSKQADIYTIAVIDHWTNYRARFVRDDEEVLPDEMWVTDEYAKKLAELEFPGMRIKQVENVYQANISCQINAHELDKIASSEGNILYALEPIHQVWNSSEQPGEFQALDFFIDNLSVLNLNDNVIIKLRPHPSETAGKYDKWIVAQKGLNISMDKSTALAESIAWADVVVGCQTYAMVVALAAGKQVISSIPPWAPPCVLPQADIIRLSDLVAQVK